MGTVLQVIVLVAVLASFVLAYLSYRAMRIYNIILVFLVFVAAMAFTYLAARTLRTHESWRAIVKAKQAEVAALEQKNIELAEGIRNQNQQAVAGLRQLRLELHRIAVDRGGVWNAVTPAKIDDKTGAISVSIEVPSPHGLADKMIVFVFDPSQYLGEFLVTKADPKTKTVDLAPNLPMSAGDLTRLSNSRGPWTMYQMMPIDDANLFASLTDAERQNLLPESSRAEYANPKRPLRSYQPIFHYHNHQLGLLQTDIGTISENIKQTKASVAKVEEEIKYREAEKADLEFDLKNFQREQAAVTDYAKKMQEQFTATRNELRKLYLSNKQAAAELTSLQLRAADAINERTGADQASIGPLPPVQP